MTRDITNWLRMFQWRLAAVDAADWPQMTRQNKKDKMQALLEESLTD